MSAPAAPLSLHASGLRFHADAAGQGPLVLCVHGFPDVRTTWRHQLPALAAAGYRAVAPSLRGYEPASVPPDGDVHLIRLVADLFGWMDALGARRAHLVGHDWGAVITWAAAALAPDRVLTLTTLAVPPLVRLPRLVRAHAAAAARLWYMALFQLPGLAERALLARDGALIRRLWADWSPGWTPPPGALDEVVRALSQPGVARAALRYYRALPRLAALEARDGWRQLLRPVHVPTLLLTGAHDGCMDSRLYDTAVGPGVVRAPFRVARLRDAGHFLHRERPDAVTDALLAWLREHG